VVGGDEMDQRTVNIRNRDDVGTKKKGKMLPLTEVVEAMVRLKCVGAPPSLLPSSC
jgi:threonyl-tRNA synthetase